MSKVVFGVGASHSTLMNTHWADVAHEPRAQQFRTGLDVTRGRVVEAAPDLVVIVGSNHFRGFFLDLMPAFTIGIGEVLSAGEAGTPQGPLSVDPAAAQAVCEHLVGAEFDVAFSARLQVDHGISHAVQYVLAGLDVPIIPVIVNVFAPPLPSLRRAESFGAALGDALRALPGARRVAIVASGGLSHGLPFPDWRDPRSGDDEFLVEAWLNGRESWTQYEERRRQIVLAAPAVINPQFDVELLDAISAGDFARYAELDEATLTEQAGNGGAEIRTWLVASAAVGHPAGEVVVYSPMPEWLTGMAIAIFTPTPKGTS
ncbi:MAG TPA: hypothetical protein VNQ73_13105 [Ilumatobacter sp.]|nr:hypothetical protein [Ilumatobacter sp.]